MLTRKENESIIIGGNIEIRIAHINRKQVKVGITAPGYISIYRKEIAPLAAVAVGEDSQRSFSDTFCDE